MVHINWAREFSVCLIPFIGFFVGRWLDQVEDERMTRFRDKSALYGRVLAPGEKPSWP